MLEHLLSARLQPAVTSVAGHPSDPVVRRSQHADFQADGALALARQLGRNPREVAQEVLDRADLADLVETAAVVGPGFINMTLSTAALERLLDAMAGDSRLGVKEAATPQRIAVDYSAPNTAKELQIGHLRSTVIGDALVRLLSWLGHDVIRLNHVGDWGTPFGMLIEHLDELARGDRAPDHGGDCGDRRDPRRALQKQSVGEERAVHELSVGDLTAFYRAARVKFDSDPAFKQRSQARVVALHNGDETTLRLWRLLVSQSEKYFLTEYARLGITLSDKDFVGESFYNPMLPGIVEDLAAKGMLHESDGALCAFPAGFSGRDGAPMPVIVRKSDGGYNYSTTDLAAIRYRVDTLKADRILYVVGTPQAQHFAMVFQTAREAGWLPASVEATHVGFGSILGSDGKLLRTRSGEAIKLSTLLDEAVARAAAVVAEKNPDLSPAERADVARAVGISAVKYADLAPDRLKDYVFDWDRMLSTTGDSGAYLQYAYARIQSLLRKAGDTPRTSIEITEPAERALALQILAFPTAVELAADNLQPHRLAGYLQALGSAYSGFWEKCPVLNSDLAGSRLALSELTARVLARGLDLLGIATLSRM
jgi:arginyl-tRNA synthetase